MTTNNSNYKIHQSKSKEFENQPMNNTEVEARICLNDTQSENTIIYTKLNTEQYII